ncbi:MAG: TIGR03000 domain-containing protein [Gemmataceae bacterium]
MFTLRHARLAGLTAVAVAAAGLLGAIAPATAQDKKATTKEAQPAAGKKVKSKIKVTVPQDDAELKIEGKDTKTPDKNPAVREFETPEIDAGKLYEYTFSATWRPNNYTVLTRSKTVEFKGGDDVVADLTKADPKVQDKAVIRWVPTPDDVVAEMVKLAGVKDGDVVYEPGPGDGRVLIAGVKAGAKKAVGIELDGKKVLEAKDNVKKAGLEKQITVIEGDALKDRDYSEASVVFLYMGNEFNNLLRPILARQLKPGTRIVSHRFILGDWAPDRSITVMGADGDEYRLHLWVVKDAKKPKE